MLNYPYLGSHAAIIFLESNICWVSSGTVSALLVTIQFTAAPKATSIWTEDTTYTIFDGICSPVLLAAAGGEGGKARHEEVQPGKNI